MGIEIQVDSLDELCDLMCGKPEEDERMNAYIIEYKQGEVENLRFNITITDADSAVEVFKRAFPEAEVIQVSRIIKKYSKIY